MFFVIESETGICASKILAFMVLYTGLHSPDRLIQYLLPLILLHVVVNANIKQGSSILLYPNRPNHCLFWKGFTLEDESHPIIDLTLLQNLQVKFVNPGHKFGKLFFQDARQDQYSAGLNQVCETMI